jgi:hypothetical protein
MANQKQAAERWTLIRHSAWTENRNPEFEHAVETYRVTGKAQMGRLAQAGAVLYGSYEKAQAAEYAVNYPEEVAGRMGIVPRALGTFKVVGNVEIYVPSQRDAA